MPAVGSVGGATLHRMPDGAYSARIPVETKGFGAVHDLYARVRLGRFGSDSEALKALARRLERI